MRSNIQTSAAWEFVRAVEAVGATDDGSHFQCMLMRRLTQTLCERAGDKRPAVIECDVKVAIAFLCPVHVVRIRFAVGNWATVPLVASTAREQNLQFEPIALREADGRVAHGIWGLREGKPLVAMTATPSGSLVRADR